VSRQARDRIVLFPDPVLSRPADPILGSGTPLEPLVARLWRACRDHDGAGLAAPQIGVPLRVAVVDAEAVGFSGREIVLIDPEIVETGPPVPGEEGCLSFPGLFATVRRPEKATIVTRTAEGRRRTLELEGLPARAVLHEIDHLDGTLMPDRMGPLRRRFFLARHSLRNGRTRPRA